MGDSAMGNHIPDFIVHYSRGEPFRSITSVCPTDLNQVIENLNESNAWGLARFSDRQYLSQRHDIEAKLRKRFIEIGGQPVLRNPIYFFPGRHTRFEEHERNSGYLIYLRDVDPRSISFTYGDSMFSFNEENRRLAGEKYLNPLCEELFSLESLPQLFTNRKFPKADPLHIEAHLWITPDRQTVKNLNQRP
ncbi:MAG: hypothetical protein KF865_06490 [Bdellovibrionaceae bacterium]|nr:hypothetical protein [Pseudobdellovibrionaceae bacterium]